MNKYMWGKWSSQLARIFLWFVVILGLFGSLISNEKPLFAKKGKEFSFPALNEWWTDWTGIQKGKMSLIPDQTYDFALYPFNRYSYDYIPPVKHQFQPPLSMGEFHNHLFGTDRLGRDVFAGVIRGFTIALKVGALSVLLSLIMGLGMGYIMGYYGDQRLRMNAMQILMWLGLFFIIIFYSIYPIQGMSSFIGLALATVLLIIAYLKHKWFATFSLHKFNIPLDFMLLKVIELFKSLPTLIILLTLLPLFAYRSTTNLIIVITLLLWTSFARHTRGETQSILEKEYIDTARAMGYSGARIFIKHVLPNIFPTMAVLATYTFGSVIVLESTLSFLGIGMPVDEVSWGSMLSEGRQNLRAWWLLVFPGLSIFFILLALNRLIQNRVVLEED